MYVRFDVSRSLADRMYEIVEEAIESGSVRKGMNETTKIVERNDAELVIMAEDVDPPEILAYLPPLCEEKDTPYGYVPDQRELGSAAGIEVGASAVAVVDSGNARDELESVKAKLEELRKGE
ncbi:MAG: 50S ribosomal protein L7Ae [Candidatus Hadarchaeia archaeon]